ncbi:MAG: ABC transporter ATP-binding protein [Deltaproteobacteria bacterium]|nr:ABC transporter ATP-binding protein [Deltaproteobacteria bacterium]
MTALLRLEDVLVRAGERPLLEVGAIEVNAGETLVILGQTGAGKSALLRVMNALIRPERGRFLWQGKEVRFPVPAAVRRRMAMAFQEPLLFLGTVFDNVAYGLRLRGVSGATLESRVVEALRLFGIEGLARRSGRTLSGGEAQRTALARAVVLQPDLLLLDEPLASLDPPTKERLEAELRRVIRSRGLTCAYVTHDRAEAQGMADRIAVLDAGALLQVGTPDDVFLRPSSERVARFVGTRNLLAGTVVGSAVGRARVAVGEHTLSAGAAPPMARSTPGPRLTDAAAAVLVCIRPEEVVLTRDGGVEPRSDADANCLCATVREVRPLGATTEVHLDCGFPLVALVTRRCAEELELRDGNAVHASFRASATHLIPASPPDRR